MGFTLMVPCGRIACTVCNVSFVTWLTVDPSSFATIMLLNIVRLLDESTEGGRLTGSRSGSARCFYARIHILFDTKLRLDQLKVCIGYQMEDIGVLDVELRLIWRPGYIYCRIVYHFTRI